MTKHGFKKAFLSIFSRAILIWLVAYLFLYFDESHNYDRRFKLRGAQPVAPQILIVLTEQADWAGEEQFRNQKEILRLDPNYFYKGGFWEQLISKLLAGGPSSIGIVFDLNNIPDLKVAELAECFYDPRLIFSARLDSEGRPVLPGFINSLSQSAALVDFHEDQDRVIRNFGYPQAPIPHMAVKLAEAKAFYETYPNYAYQTEYRLINFRGPAHTFPSIKARDLLAGKISPEVLKNKIIIIGSQSFEGQQVQTPLGTLSRAELMANITDNILQNRWLHRPPNWVHAFYLMVIILAAFLLLQFYPQTISLFILFWVSTFWTAISLWIFDRLNLWTPILTVWITLILSYVVALAYQLSLRENENWRLEQETKTASELEQLKTNFVSLISHDLKTPLAKIQAICDRLLTASDQDWKDGLQNIRKESTELNRYIQTILQISRVESRQISLHRQAVDLNQTIEEVIQQLLPIAQQKSIEIESKLEPLFTVEADPLLIHEVIMNLIENAIKYSPSKSKIHVTSLETPTGVRIAVEDNGPGIGPEDLARIFDKFYRGQNQKSVQGTGLGLFLVKYFVERHGGHVFIESKLQHGTTVGFELPFETMEATHAET